MEDSHVYMRTLINAPCVTQKDGKKSAPCVDCDWNCDACGWNPRELTRRWNTGTFANGQLRFKRRFAR